MLAFVFATTIAFASTENNSKDFNNNDKVECLTTEDTPISPTLAVNEKIDALLKTDNSGGEVKITIKIGGIEITIEF